MAVCIAPADAVIARPPSWGPGQALEISKGTHHIAQDAKGDSYPNQEFTTFYEYSDYLDDSDPRARFLTDFWAEQGYAGIKVWLARKVRPAIVVGQVAPEAAGCVFRNHEGVSEIEEGCRILRSPDDANTMWLITAKVFEKKYQDVVLED